MLFAIHFAQTFYKVPFIAHSFRHYAMFKGKGIGNILFGRKFYPEPVSLVPGYEARSL